jgi:hypothetical protein
MPFVNPAKFINESYDRVVEFNGEKFEPVNESIGKEEVVAFVNKFAPVFESFVNLLANYIRSKGAVFENTNINLNQEIKSVISSVVDYIVETDRYPSLSLLKEYAKHLEESCKKRKKPGKKLTVKESVDVLRETVNFISTIEKSIYNTEIKRNLDKIVKEITENQKRLLESGNEDLTVLIEREVIKRILNRTLLEAIFGALEASKILENIDSNKVYKEIVESINELSTKMVNNLII